MATAQKKARTVVGITGNDKNFSTLDRALKSTDLVETLNGKGPFTIFAPTDDAFDRLSDTTRNSLFDPKNKEQLQELLEHHVVQGRHRAKDLMSRSSISPMEGRTLHLQNEGNSPKIGDATLPQTDLEAENGIVHAINRVLRA